MYPKLKELIDINSIDENKLFKSVYLDIREIILKEICEYMKSDNKNEVQIRSVYYRNSDNNMATRIVLRNICKLEMPEEDIAWLTSCIQAFFHKKPHRISIADSIKKDLLNKQGYKCAICKKEITNYSMHVDHIVPWDYVGDELSNNYQALCSSCNGHKSNHVAEAVKNLILKY